MSEHIEKIADFKIVDIMSRGELFTVSTPDEMPFGKLMNLDFIFMNIKSDVKYHVEVLINENLLSITSVNVPKAHLMYPTVVDGTQYGKAQGDFNFNLAVRDYGSFKLECVLFQDGKEKDRMAKYYSFEDHVWV